MKKEELDFYLQYSGSVEVSSMSRYDLKNLIATGESSFLEFKHRVASPEKIAKEIAAFCNTTGGTILIGVADNGEMVGVESYMEEEFWINQAAKEVCIPEVDLRIELMNIGNRDILIVKVPEAPKKPVYLKGKKSRKVFIRQEDESVLASDEYVEMLKLGEEEEGVTFEYGENEQLLFRFLKEYSEITVERFSKLINVTTYRAAKILVNLVSAGVLDLFEKDGVAHYTFSKKSA
ncbi:MAG TPA: ATP-binding protein [Balneolaceae bacterium]|nr:ATP-binding protein [Balneolaceae bacterium]|tara:strand:- start:15496 stop:16197 length:702 start_codon:yes stop_codon:yes gene_type:complete